MRISSTNTATGTLSRAEATNCGFDPDGAAHLMSILSNIYRDPWLAVLREYAANACDAHRQAGSTDPIQVTLPTDIEPTLTVADRGTGLSEDEIVAVYATYGTSTKRDSDEQVGAFGIGAKSAFAVATQFSVVGTKDGRRTVALFALDDAGVATVTVVARESTDEPDGVTVSVPVTDPAAVRRAADRLFGYWEPGSVVVNGEVPQYLPAASLRVTDTLYARFTDDSANESPVLTVVMGGIPYPASVSMLETVARRTEDQAVRDLVQRLTLRGVSLRLMAFAPIGSVDITPSREDLRDTPRTLGVLAQLFTEYVTEVAAAVQRELSCEPSPMHAVIRLGRLWQFVPGLCKSMVWRDHQFAGPVTLPFPSITLTPNGKTHRARLHDITAFTLMDSRWDGIRVVTGVGADNLNRVRRVANRYMTHHGLTTLLLAPTGRATVGWYSHGEDGSPLGTITVADYLADAAVLPATSTRAEPAYQVMHRGQVKTLPLREIKMFAQGGGRVLVTDYKTELTGWLRDVLAPTDMLVMLTGAQTETALRRRLPGVLDAATLVRTQAQRLLDGASEQELLALHHRHVHWINRVATTPLRTLPPVRALIDRYQAGDRAYRDVGTARRNQLHQAACEVGAVVALPDHTTGFPVLDLVLRGLPDTGVDTVTDTVLDHLAHYMRAVGGADSAHAA